MKMGQVWSRLYADFLMPCRLDDYQRVLLTAFGEGYRFHSVRSFWEALQGGHDLAGRHLILRHDIDTDCSTARAMFSIEQKVKACSSFYFRLSTVDVALMREIEKAGSEASYHFEEIATVAKRRRLHYREEVSLYMAEIRHIFRKNLEYLRSRTGLAMVTVASHGDFVNRGLGMANWELLDGRLRQELGIRVEAYDAELNRPITSRHSDSPYPEFWQPDSPTAAFLRGEPVVYILTHPRHWRVSRWENLVDNVQRLLEGVRYEAGDDAGG